MERPYSATQLALLSLTILFFALGVYWIVVTPRGPAPAAPRIRLEAPPDERPLLAAEQPARREAPPAVGQPVEQKRPEPAPLQPPRKKKAPESSPGKLEQEARAALAAGKLDRAEQLYRKLLEQEGRRHLASLARVRHLRWVARGDQALRRGKLEQAGRAYARALEEGPSIETERKLFGVRTRRKARQVAADQHRRLEALVRRAEQAAAGGELQAAVRSYEEALALSPDPGPLQQKLQQARLALLKKLERRDSGRWLARARTLVGQRRWADAQQAYDKAAAGGELEPADRQQLARIRRELAIAEMVLVPRGAAWIGSGRAADEQPPRRVEVPAFYIDRYEVTHRQYDQFVRATGHRTPISWADGGPPDGQAGHPVTGVSLDDALAYARWAGKRLPTEIEWERAARGDDRRRFPWGEQWSAGRANTLEQGTGGAVAVGRYREGTSPFGVHDLLGNALEWTASPYRPYPGSKAQTDEARYVLRGGCWYFAGKKLSVTARYPDLRTSRLASYGFRCALDANHRGAATKGTKDSK